MMKSSRLFPLAKDFEGFIASWISTFTFVLVFIPSSREGTLGY